MGTYFNPGNESFTCDKNSKIYIDKTGLLEYLNDVICTNGKCIAVSHARRFGKSHAAGMIDAYYNIVREFPAAKGFADLVFIPRANAGKRPAMVVELKYNQSADSAIQQIKEKRYHCHRSFK